MTVQPDKFIADVVQTFMGLTEGRVVLYDENWEPPKDSGIYVTVSNGQVEQLGVNEYFDSVTNESVTEASMVQEIVIQITSKNRDAILRRFEIPMSLVSQYCLEKQDSELCKVTRKGNMLDLSFIEGSSSLKRFSVNCSVFYIQEIRKPGNYFQHFQENTPEVILNETVFG